MNWLHDVRFAVRTLAKSPGFAIVTILILALGIGANVAVFSLVDELWIRPRPVPHPERVLRVFTSNAGSEGIIARGYSSYPDFLDVAQRAKTLDGIASLERRGATLAVGDGIKLISAAVVSPNFFDVLQPNPARGRTFTAAEAQSPKARVLMISYPFWREQFNGDPALAGHTIVLDKQDVLVAGVLPRGFRGTEPTQVPDVWIPQETWSTLTGERNRTSARAHRDYELFARLRPGISLQQANAELTTIASALELEYPSTNKGRQMSAVRERDATDPHLEQLTVVLLGISGLVLLIACANVSGLLVARAEYRRHELSTRVALGAGRGRLFRQLFLETAALGVAATAAAIFVADNMISVIPKLMTNASFVAPVDAHIDARVLLFAILMAMISVVVFGSMPAWQASKVAPASALKQQTLRGVRTAGRASLVVAQVAVSLVLVISAGLLVRSLDKALATNPGFDAHQNMLVLEGVSNTPTMAKDKAFVEEVRRRLEATPGVLSTAVAQHVPFSLSGSGATRKIFLPNRPEITVSWDPVSDHYFEALGTRILQGRPIEARDEDLDAKGQLLEAGRVLVVNQTMARRYWPGEDPIGKQLRLDKPDGDLYRVVGVAEDSANAGFGEDSAPYMYTPMSGYHYGEFALVVKTQGSPAGYAAQVRQRFHEVDATSEIIYLATLKEHVAAALSDQRAAAKLIVSLSGLGLLLAAVGLYGLTAFLVGRRTQEIGIRMALGAQRALIFQMVIRRALLLTAAGVVVGGIAAIPATSALRAFLFGVNPHDALSFAAAVVVLAAVACAAAFFPAVKATRVDPMVALRYE